MNKIYLVPVGAAKIKCPKSGRVLPAEGGEVEATTFWRRRLAAGEVKEGKKPVADKKPAKEKVDAQKVENNGGKK